MTIHWYRTVRVVLALGAILCCLCCSLPRVWAQSAGVYTPTVGSEERKAIMDAMRVPIQRELKQSVVFVVKTLRVQDGWAFVRSVPQSNGRPVSLSSVSGAGSDGTVTALLRSEGGQWRIVTHALGNSRMVSRWPTLYHAPRAIFDFGSSPSTPSVPSSGPMYTPGPGSAERKALMDALRPSVEKVLKQSVVFQVQTLHVLNGWAFFYGRPLQPNGRPVDYSRTPFAQEVKEGVFGDNVCALYHKVNGRWRVVASRVGSTDVAWETWDRDYHAPRAIFKMNNG